MKAKRMKTFDELHKGAKGRPQILNCLSPVPAEPFAITMQKAFESDHLDAVDPTFTPPEPEE